MRKDFILLLNRVNGKRSMGLWIGESRQPRHSPCGHRCRKQSPIAYPFTPCDWAARFWTSISSVPNACSCLVTAWPRA